MIIAKTNQRKSNTNPKKVKLFSEIQHQRKQPQRGAMIIAKTNQRKSNTNPKIEDLFSEIQHHITLSGFLLFRYCTPCYNHNTLLGLILGYVYFSTAICINKNPPFVFIQIKGGFFALYCCYAPISGAFFESIRIFSPVLLLVARRRPLKSIIIRAFL